MSVQSTQASLRAVTTICPWTHNVQKQIDIAVQAFLQGFLIPTYTTNNGRTKTIKCAQKLTSLILGGFIVRQVGGKFFISRGLWGGLPPTEVEAQLNAKPREQKSVFISYQWSPDTTAIADEMQRELESRDYLVIRDKKNLHFGDDLKDFMSIINHPHLDYVITIISDAYLKADNCMYEVTQVVKRRNFADTLLPCVVKDTNIYGNPDVLQPYLDHWTSKLDAARRSPNPDSSYIETVEEILRWFRKFMDSARGKISVSSEDLQTQRYQQFFDRMGPSISASEVKLRNLKDIRLNDEDIKKDLACYISVRGSRSVFEAKEQTFDLDQTIETFLRSGVEVFLLLGNAGSGKSTYLQYLENRLWKEWQPDKPIPLFIDLPTLRMPYGRAIEEVLTERGFSLAEQQRLRTKHKFIILCDGYDELQEMNNLYDSNHLKDWSAKVIITCRTQSLYGNQASYHNYFAPEPDFISTSTFEEASIVPFSQEQVRDYCIQFIVQYGVQNWTWDHYKSAFEAIDNIHEMVENPFLLRIIAEVIPGKVANRGNQTEKFSRMELFDAFIKRWFDREHRRHMSMLPRNFDAQKTFGDAARKLALEMVQNSVVSIHYEEDRMAARQTIPWSWLFEVNMEAVRLGIPMRKIGPHSYAFIQEILRDYFCARAILPDRTFIEEHLNKKNLSGEPEIIRFLGEYVMKDPSLAPQLFKLIYRSMESSDVATAAANAITILNAAQVNLSKLNLKGARLAGANLSGAVLTGTDLSEADLQGVNFSESILDYSTMASSNVRGIELGQKPIIQAPHAILVVSSDGNLAICRDLHGSYFVWNCIAKQLEYRLNTQVGSIQAVVFSANCELVLSGGDDGAVRLWKSDTKQEQHSFRGHEKRVLAVALSKDGRRALSGSEDGTVRLWSCEDGRQLKCFSHEKKPVSCVALSSDGNWALSSDREGQIRLWNCRAAEEKPHLQALFADVRALAISHDGAQALLVGVDKVVRLFDCSTWQERYSFQGHSGSVSCLAFSPDGKTALSGSNDKTVRLLDCQIGRTLFCFTDHHESISSVTFSSEGKTAISSDTNKCIKSFKVDRQAIHKASNPLAYGKTAVVSLDGCRVLSGDERDSQGNTIHLWDCLTGKKIRSFRFQNGAPNSATVQSLTISPDGKRAVSGESDGDIRIWDCETGIESVSFHAHNLRTDKVAFSRDGTLIVSGGEETNGTHTVKLWDIDGHEQLCLRAHSAAISFVALSPDNDRVLSGSNDNTVRIWDRTTEQQRFCFSEHLEGASSANLGIRNASLSSNGQWVLSAGIDKTLRYWSSANGTVTHSFQLSNFIYDAALSPNGRWAVASSDDLVVRIWDCETGKLVYSRAFEYSIRRVQFLPNGREILFLSHQQSLYLWEFFNEENHVKPSLKWTTAQSALSAYQLNVTEALGLTNADKNLLEQLGAKFSN